MVEKAIIGSIGMDAVKHYEDVLRNDALSRELRFLPTFIAHELSSNPEIADIMLKHPYYNIRGTYAGVTQNQDHLRVLSNDIDWRVRVDILKNPHIDQHTLDHLSIDEHSTVKSTAITTKEIRSLVRK